MRDRRIKLKWERRVRELWEADYRKSRSCKGPFTRYDRHIRLFILMYPIQSYESSGLIATFTSK